MSTARSLINRAMRKAGILVKSEVPDADEASDALEELKSLVQGWSNDPLLVYSRELDSFTLTSGVYDYTVGPGGDFNITRPMRVISAYTRQGQINYPLTIIGEEVFSQITFQSLSPFPGSMVFNNGYPLARIKLFPTPSVASQFFMLSEKPLASIDTLDTVISMPPGWDDAIVYNLCIRLAPEYRQPIDPMIAELARKSLALIRSDTEKARMSFARGPSVAERNIYTGWYT